MGVNLSGLIEPKTIELSELRGKKVAIDAYNTIYQFLSIVRQPDGSPLCDRSGRVTSQLSGILYRTTNLIGQGIDPVFVFDGKPHDLKKATLDERKERREKATAEWEAAKEAGDMKKAFSKAQQTARMTPEIRQSARDLIGLLGYPIVDAPHDGEAQAAYMCKKGDVFAAASQDFDSLLFGTPLLVRNMTVSGRRKIPGKDLYRDVKPEMIDSASFLNELGITREQLVDVCIMMGTDFNEGLYGIGPKKGLKLVKEYGGLEHILPQIDKEIPNYPEIREIFLGDDGSDDYDLTTKKIERDSIIDLLISYDFSKDRVESTLDKLEAARKAEDTRRKQRTLF